MNYQETTNKSLETINNLFLIELQKNFPSELFQKYKEVLLKMVNKELSPICREIMEKNKTKLELKWRLIQKEEINEEEKQIKFNEELNSLFNFFGKIKMTQKAFLIQKNGINYIKFNEGQFSNKKKKQDKEMKIFEKLKKEYSI